MESLRKEKEGKERKARAKTPRDPYDGCNRVFKDGGPRCLQRRG